MTENNFSTTTRGAITEYIVVADLLRMGWSVYRSCSPSAPWDLIACRDGKSVNIEVKTGYKHDRNPLGSRPRRHGELALEKYKKRGAHVVAIGYDKKEVDYFPKGVI